MESEDLFLINTPRGKVDIDDYPAVRNWLLSYRDKLEARATEQAWWELQQAQLAYQSTFSKPKLVYQDITATNPFTLDESSCIPNADLPLLGLLNSRVAWCSLLALTNIARGGYLRLRSDFVERLPVYNNAPERAGEFGPVVRNAPLRRKVDTAWTV